MKANLPRKKKLIPISEAAEVLGVSVDTIRRWDKKGTLHAERPNGKTRYFSLEEIENIKFSKPLSISEASKQLGLSASTLRRLEEREVLKPDRNDAGERQYTKKTLEEFLHSEYFLRKKAVEEKILEPFKTVDHKDDDVLFSDAPKSQAEPNHKTLSIEIEEQRRRLHHLTKFQRSLWSSLLFLTTTFILLVTIITVAFLMYPEETALFFGYRSQVDRPMIAGETDDVQVLGATYPADAPLERGTLVGRALKPFSRVSLAVVKRIDEDTYEEIIPDRRIPDVNDVFTIDEEGYLTNYFTFRPPDSSFLAIPDKELIENLNSDYIRGRVPGGEVGNLVYFGEDGVIDGLSVGSEQLRAGSVIGGVGGVILDSSISAFDLADGSVTTPKLAEEAVTEAKISGKSVSEGKLADGAVTSDKIADDTITSKDLAQAIVLGDGDFLDLGSIVHNDRGMQGLRLPNVPTSTPEAPESGEGYIIYSTAGDEVMVFSNGAWSSVGGGDITGVTVGNGMTGGGLVGDLTVNLDVTTSGTTLTNSANSGLELAADGLSMLRGCADNEILKWDSGSGVWQCEGDVSGAGAVQVEEGDSSVVGSLTNLDFLAADFIVSQSPVGEGNVSIDYANSSITRSSQAEAITGGWTFNTLGTTFATSIAANGGITFDQTTDTIGAHTAAGTYDMNTNLITNIGNAGTDFVSGGGLTLAGTLTANGQVTLGDDGDTVAIDSSDWNIDATGAITGISLDANGTGNSLSNIENADLASDTLDWDKFANAMTVDEATTLASTIDLTTFDLNHSPVGTAASPHQF